MWKGGILSLMGYFIVHFLVAQPSYAPDIQKEKLGRGLTLLHDGDSLVISWRLLEGEKNTLFSVYENGKRLNEQNITDKTFFKTIAPEKETPIILSMIKNEREFIYETTYTPDLKNYIPISLSKPMAFPPTVNATPIQPTMPVWVMWMVMVNTKSF